MRSKQRNVTSYGSNGKGSLYSEPLDYYTTLYQSNSASGLFSCAIYVHFLNGFQKYTPSRVHILSNEFLTICLASLVIIRIY
jgi:hypothetical protein